MIENYILKQRQSNPLEVKIQMSLQKIREWYTHWQGMVYVAFSGGKPIEEILQWANACGALSTTKPGAQPSMPSREELISFIKEYPR